jgi:nicotinic acid mononucleotide adenylyltransferase
MAVRAFADREHVVVSDTEVERGEHGEPGYMVDTVEEMLELPAQLGYDDLVVEASLVIGADQASTLPDWDRFGRLSQLVRIIVVRRPDELDDAALDTALTQLREEWGLAPQIVDMAPVAISSTHVRDVAATGDRAALAKLVPWAIVDDVLRLYGS